MEWLDAASIHVDGVAKRLECEEGYSHGEEYVEGVEVQPHCRCPHLAEEVGVLEVAEQAEVDGKAQSHKELAQAFTVHLLHGAGDDEVAHCDYGKEEEVEAAALVVEIVGEEGDEEDAQCVGLAEHVVYQCETEKEKEEYARGENHGRVWHVLQLL